MNNYSYLSHSLLGPFTAIFGFLDICAMNIDDGARLIELGKIRAAAQVLHKRIEAALALLKLPYVESGCTKIEGMCIKVKTENLKRLVVLLENLATEINHVPTQPEIVVGEKVSYVFPTKVDMRSVENEDPFVAIMKLGYSPEHALHLFAAQKFALSLGANIVFGKDNITLEFLVCPRQFS